MEPDLKEIISRLKEEHGEEALLSVLRDGDQTRKRGRPKGSGIDDGMALLHMAVVLDVGRADSDTDAARQSLHLTEGASTDSTIRRLRLKYKRWPPQRVAEAIEARKFFLAGLARSEREFGEMADAGRLAGITRASQRMFGRIRARYLYPWETDI